VSAGTPRAPRPGPRAGPPRRADASGRAGLPALVWPALAALVLLVGGGAWALTSEDPDPHPTAPVLSPDPAYGAGDVGASAEPCTTDGARATPDDVDDRLAAAAPGDTVLLTEGTYDGLDVPAGRTGARVTVKPYDCAPVVVDGPVRLSSYTTVAGMRLEAPDDEWVLLIGSRGEDPREQVTVRHNTVRGGTIEAVRIHDNVSDVDVRGNDLDGGRDNHVLKVVSETGEYHPDRVTVASNLLHKDDAPDDTEDLLQAEGHARLTVTRNTFGRNPGEDAVDVKTGTVGVTLTRNYFAGPRIAGECVLVQGSGGRNVVARNYLDTGCSLSVGAHLSDSAAVLRENRLVNGLLRLRRSSGVEVLGNVMEGGTLKLGVEDDDDQPRDAVLTGNVLLGTQTLDRTTPAGLDYTCTGNVLHDTRGDRLRCTGTDTSDPGPTPDLPADAADGSS
jgi:hypothetical protein